MEHGPASIGAKELDPSGHITDLSAARTATRPCPACGDRRAALVHTLRIQAPAGHPLDGGYDVVSCWRCGTGFADVVVCDAYYDRYYAEVAKYATEAPTGRLATVGDVPEWIRDRFEATADQLVALVPDRDARVLDVGCANGSLLDTLARRGYRRLIGVDPSPHSASIAADRGLRVEVGTFARFPAGLGRFDAICLTGVLEHVWNLDQAIGTLVDHLAPGGVIFVAVPDAARYLDPYIAPFQDFSSEHVNHFSPASLRVLAARFGLATIWSAPADSALAPDSLCAGTAAAWQQTPSGEVPVSTTRDEVLVETLQAFTARSIADFAAIDQRLECDLAGSERFAVWGFGELTMKLLASPALAERELVAVADGNPSRHGVRVRGVPVTSPDSLPRDATPIVVGSLLSGSSIVEELRRRGCPNPVLIPAA